MVEDREIQVSPGDTVRTAWVDIDQCYIVNRSRMSPEAVEKKYRKLLQAGDSAFFPPPNGRWEGSRFAVLDGRHEYIAALMLGRDKVLVAWVEKSGSA